VTVTPASGLCASAVSRRYPGDIVALDSVSLRIAAGERVAVVGESGSGKTTVLRILLALESPDSGSVTLDGRPVTPGSARSTRWFRRQVQFVPQDPGASLDPRRTVLDSVAAPMQWLRLDGDHRARAREALDAVRIPSALVGARVEELSGGQRQRVALARAIAGRPRFLLADEPVSGLDLGVREVVVSLLDSLCTDTGMSLVMVTHDFAVAARTGDRIVVVHDGRIVEDGPSSRVLGAPRHPRTRSLLDAVPRLERSDLLETRS